MLILVLIPRWPETDKPLRSGSTLIDGVKDIKSWKRRPLAGSVRICRSLMIACAEDLPGSSFYSLEFEPLTSIISDDCATVRLKLALIELPNVTNTF